MQDYPLEVKLKIWINRGERQRLDREMQRTNIWREQHTGTGAVHTDLGLNCYRAGMGQGTGLGPGVYWSCIWRYRPYRAVNTIRLG